MTTTDPWLASSADITGLSIGYLFEALSADGLNALVGGGGTVKSYSRTSLSAVWAPSSSDITLPTFGNVLSAALSADGLNALVGSSGTAAVKSYSRTSLSAAWAPSSADIPNFSGSLYVALSADGLNAISKGTSTTVKSYSRPSLSGSWAQSSPDIIGLSHPDIAIALSADGLNALVRNGNTISSYARTSLTNTWSTSSANLPSFGGNDCVLTVALSADGLHALVGEDNNGAGIVHSYSRSTLTAAWSTSSIALSGFFGGFCIVSVALSADGLHTIIGDNTGKVFSYTRATTSGGFGCQNVTQTI